MYTKKNDLKLVFLIFLLLFKTFIQILRFLKKTIHLPLLLRVENILLKFIKFNNIIILLHIFILIKFIYKCLLNI